MAEIKDARLISSRLRTIRLENGWTLDEVAGRTGISKATLSKLENGRTNLTFATVLKLSQGLDIPISMLTNATDDSVGRRRSITRSREGATFEADDAHWQLLSNDLAGQDRLYVRATIRTRTLDEQAPWRKHPGQEFLYVLSGTLTLHTEAYLPLVLESGDSIAFDSSMGHKYVASSRGKVEVLMAVQGSGYTDVDEVPY